MSSTFSSLRAITQMFDGKLQQFISDIDNVHMLWLEEIQQEANRMFSSDFSAEPELMPKTPSQKKSNRRKRVSLGHQEENQARRRFSKGKRSKLRDSSVTPLNLIAEIEGIPEPTSSGVLATEPKRSTRRNKQTQQEVAADAALSSPVTCVNEPPPVPRKQLEGKEADRENQINVAVKAGSPARSSPNLLPPDIQVTPPSESVSAEKADKPVQSPGRSAIKIAIADATNQSRRSSARHSLKLRHSLAGLRHSMTHEVVRRTSRRSLLKKRAQHGNSTFSSDDACVEIDMDGVEEMGEKILSEVQVEEWETEESTEPKSMTSSLRITRSMAVNSPKVAPANDHVDHSDGKPTTSNQMSRQSIKRKAPDIEEISKMKPSPPKKSQSIMRPHMKSFLHTVQKNQMLMMTPSSLGRATVMKSFIKNTTPLKLDFKTKERMKLEALKKKQEQEEERMRKMEEDKRRKQEEQKRKRDERLKRVVEARVKEGLKEEEKKKKIEQNDKLRVERLAEEKAKKRVALKRQEEEARKKKLQQAEEEKRQLELLAKRKAEEEEQQRAIKLSEARRAQELKREQERELERERQAAAERERVEREKAIAFQRELEKAAREKERRELEEKRREHEEKRKMEEQRRLAAEEKAAKEREAAKRQEAAVKNVVVPEHAAGLNVTVDIEHSVLSTPVGKGAGLNVTVDIEQSPQSYKITPKGGNRLLVLSKNPENYGMDQNSDDSTDDESAPRKPIPSWAEGQPLQQSIIKQYFNPTDLDAYFGAIELPRLENIFYKSKPRYFKRTSSAVWHSPPRSTHHF